MDVLTKFTRMNLAAFGAWPDQKNDKLSLGLFIICFLCLLLGVFLPQTFKMFQVWNDFDLLSNVLCTAELSVFIAAAKMVVIFFSKESMYFSRVSIIK